METYGTKSQNDLCSRQGKNAKWPDKRGGTLEGGPRVNRDSRSLPRQISPTNTFQQQCVKYWHQGNKRAKRAPSAYQRLSRHRSRYVPPPTHRSLPRSSLLREIHDLLSGNPMVRVQTDGEHAGKRTGCCLPFW